MKKILISRYALDTMVTTQKKEEVTLATSSFLYK